MRKVKVFIRHFKKMNFLTRLILKVSLASSIVILLASLILMMMFDPGVWDTYIYMEAANELFTYPQAILFVTVIAAACVEEQTQKR